MFASPAFEDLSEFELLVIACSDAPSATNAFGVLVQRYYYEIQHFIEFLSGDVQGVAPDLTQDTFVAAFSHLSQLRDRRLFRPWLHQIARNVWKMDRRQYEKFPLRYVDDVSETLESLYYRHQAIEAYPEIDLIHATFVRLTKTSREALYLRHLAGFSDAEIAEALGISQAAAQKRAYRAEAQFRQQYHLLSEPTEEIEVHHGRASV